MNPIGNLHDFIDALPVAARLALDAASRWRELPVGGHVLRAGSRPPAVYRIEQGRVKYCAWDHQGRELLLTYMTRGDWVGLSEVFTGLPAQWNVVAQTPVRLRVVRRRDFEMLVDTYPALARQLLRIFALRFGLYRLFGLDHSALSLKERVVKMLYFLSWGHDKEADAHSPIVLRLSQAELGKAVGASRQKLNPVLKALEREQLLEVRFGALALLGRARIVAHYGYLLAAAGDPDGMSPR